MQSTVLIRPTRGRRRSSANQIRPINSVAVMTRRVGRIETVFTVKGANKKGSDISENDPAANVER